MAAFIDTHAHIDDKAFGMDVDQVLSDAWAAGVRYVICPGSDWASSKRVRELAHRKKNVDASSLFYAVGYHPHEAKDMDSSFFEWVRGLKGDTRLVAIGEIGLDYYYDHSPRDCQKETFADQIGLAKELGLPVIVHDRDAHADTLDVMRAEGVSNVGGVLHCFSGSWEMAKACLDMGLYIAFGGPVTFKNAVRPREVAAKVPLDRLLSETDSPYLTPEPFRGKRNEPSRVVQVTQKLAELRGISLDSMCQALIDNASTLFRLQVNECEHRASGGCTCHS